MLALAGLSIVGNAYALPTVYPTKVTYSSEIKNTTNSNLVADDTDERVFYVMPPNSAKASVLGLHTMKFTISVFVKKWPTLKNIAAILQK